MEQETSRPRWPLAALVTAAIVATPAVAQSNGKARMRHSDVSRTQSLHGTQLADKRGRIEAFVRLDEPAVAELNAQSMETTGSFASPDAQRTQAQRVSAQHSRFKPQIVGRGLEVLSEQRVGANGFRVKGTPAEIASLRSMPGVLSVAPVKVHKLDNIESVPWIGAPAVWSAVGKGEGVKIGIIDSGIDYTHATFGGSGNPSDYAGNDPNVIEPGSFPTAKVKGGFDFAGPTYDANDPESEPQPDSDPLDLGGHGSHVAGTAAGIGVPGTVGAGVAPGAELYALKVFGDAGGSTNLTSLAIEWAMDPNGDGDMSDHLDVINMSLGSPFGEPDDPSAISANNAAAVGIIVVASAGNEGSVPYITGSPAIASSALSVAANTPGARIVTRFNVTAPANVAGRYLSLEGSGPVTFASLDTVSGALVPSAPADGCAPLTNTAAVNGKIALVIRGTCSFVDKYLNAQAAGAKAIVVYNDGTAADRIEPLVMTVNDTRVTIPGLMIAAPVGTTLANTPNVAVTLDRGLDPSLDDKMTGFSSRGPGQGGSVFKPDLSAPGESIVSTRAGSGTGGRTLGGTSMAAPHVAGAAALLRQKHPKLNQSAIKALLQNSTANANPSGDSDLTRQGVGALRVDRAVALTSYASPGGVSFGRLNPLRPMLRTERVRLKNLNGTRRSFSVRHVAHKTYPGVQVRCPSNVRVGGRDVEQFHISLTFNPAAAWAAGAFDGGVVSQTEVDGWCVLNDGKDTLRVGYVAVVDPAANVTVLPGVGGVKVRNNGPSLGWAEAFTLAKVGGEQQNGTYGSIAAVGFRRAPNPARYAPAQVLEVGLVMERPFEHLSSLFFELAIDTNSDGTPDAFLVGADLSRLIDGEDPGQFVTAQFNDEDGFIDWEANDWDFNDRTLFLPFTLAATEGLAPEKFDYVLTVTAGNGDEDVQRGTIDLSKEIVPDMNSFGVEPGDSIDVKFSGPTGSALWLLQNNVPLAQSGLSLHFARKK